MDQEQNMTGAQSPAAAGGKSATPLIGGIILLIVLAAVGWYVFKGGMGAAPEMMPGTEMPAAPDTATEALKMQGTSDEVQDIEADLNATDLNSLEEIQQI